VFKLFFPAILERKVLFEKYKASEPMMTNFMLKNKNTFLASLISWVASFFIVYWIIFCFRLQPKISDWFIYERAILLIGSCVIALGMFFFCSYQGSHGGEYTTGNSIELKPLSRNWIVKFVSVFCIYIGLLIVAILVYMFCCFTLDLTTILNLKIEDRGTINILLFIGTIALCRLGHIEVIPLYQRTT
jgi:hypothetical protein